MELITSSKPVFKEQTLDSLWREAEEMGAVTVDKSWSNGSPYKVEIMFKRKSGTRIHATGTNTDIVFALSDAINEAREMGA